MKLFPVVGQASLYSLTENKCLIKEAYIYIQTSWIKCRKLIFNYTWWCIVFVICDIFWCLFGSPVPLKLGINTLSWQSGLSTTHFQLNFSLFLNLLVKQDFSILSCLHAFIQAIASTWNSRPSLISTCETCNAYLLLLTTQHPFLFFFNLKHPFFLFWQTIPAWAQSCPISVRWGGACLWLRKRHMIQN